MQSNVSNKSLEELPAKYRSLFSSYPHFNSIQSQVLDNVMKSNNSMVVAAPTGSGKTGVLELAIVKLLMDVEKSGISSEFKIVYVCPVKALCRERFDDWNPRFGKLGVSCIEVTGDGGDYFDLRGYNLIITTPEKWDSLTRKWRDNSSLVQMVKLFMIDEVHLLSDNKRGPVLEAIVCRMKTISKMLDSVRFFAVSATIYNVEDLASWLGSKDQPAFCYKFGSEVRPVTLEKIVKGYSSSQNQGFKFDIQLSYRLKPIILEHSKGKPILIFCSSRKSVLMTAQVLSQELTFHFSDLQKKNLKDGTASVTDSKLKELMLCGVGYHHAGLIAEDRNIVQNLFVAGYLPVLIATSTLAMGVNLPAHLVIIKSTKQFNAGQTVEYPESSILQMIGRAGRPQFDKTAVAVIMTEEKNVGKYERLLDSKEIVESSLHLHLPEYLNSEIVLYTITNLTVAMNWIRSTFLYVRALKNPRYYGFDPKATPEKIEKSLETICQKEINGLKKSGLIEVKPCGEISPTADGRLMSHFYLSFETFKIFLDVKENESLEDLLTELTNAAEFSEITSRMSERRCLNDLNKCKNKESIRFPLKGSIKTRPMKINVLIQAVLGCLAISDPSLNQEAFRIVYVAERLTKCLSEFLSKKNFYGSVLNSLILAKCLKARLWRDSPYVCRQLERIGPTLCSLLSSCGKTSFEAIRESNPRDLERILNRAPPFGNVLQDAVRHLPKYDLKLERFENRINVTISLTNSEILQEKNTAGDKHWSTLIVGDSDNNVLSYCKISDRDLCARDWKVFVVPKGSPRTISADLISETWVGIDVSQSIEINPVVEEEKPEKVKRKRKAAVTQVPKTPKKRKEGKEFDFLKQFAYKPKEKENFKPARKNSFVPCFDVDIDIPEEVGEVEEKIEEKICRMVEKEPEMDKKIQSCDFRRKKNPFVPFFDVDIEILDELPARKKNLNDGGKSSASQNRSLMQFEESLDLGLKAESHRNSVIRPTGIPKNLGFPVRIGSQFRENLNLPEKNGTNLVDSRSISENFLSLRNGISLEKNLPPVGFGNKFTVQKPGLAHLRSDPVKEKNYSDQWNEILEKSIASVEIDDRNLVKKSDFVDVGNSAQFEGKLDGSLDSSFEAEKRSPVRKKTNLVSLQNIYEMLKQTPRKLMSNLGL